MNFVLDASVVLLWLVPETNPAGVGYASAALKALKESQAIVPSLLALEAANVVAKVESRGLVTEADSQRFIALLGRLNIVTDQAQKSVTVSTVIQPSTPDTRAVPAYPMALSGQFCMQKCPITASFGRQGRFIAVFGAV
ncbi:MAG: type II toxin-antitoxin system VapC family toxin [Rhodoferax sp.]|nr:type II toxin-antitoxin system VapC family toxin [Rhodoferax sp.]